MNRNNFSKGFTLIETVVALSIFAVIFVGVAVMLADVFINSSKGMSSLDNIDQARAVAMMFTNEIRSAVIGNDGSYLLAKTGEFELVFFSGFKTQNQNVNRIRYFVSNKNCSVLPDNCQNSLCDTLCKGIIQPSAGVPVYNLAEESIKPVVGAITNGAAPVFYYYNGTYSGSGSALQQPILDISQIRFININLLVDSFKISSGASIRSIKDNLGN